MSDLKIWSLAQRADWQKANGEFALPSQSWLYASALSASGYEPQLAVIEARGSKLFLPYFERTFSGTTDIATLPSLSGGTAIGPIGPVLEIWRDYAASRGWVAGYLYIGSGLEATEGRDAYEVFEHGALFALNPMTWSPQTSTSATIRQKIALAQRKAANYVSGEAVPRGCLERLYLTTMRRLGTEPAFSSATLAQWEEGEPNTLVAALTVAGKAEAIHLVHISGRHAELHLAGSTEEGRDLSAFLYSQMILTLRSRGVEYLNLGGGAHPDNGLYKFESWLGGQPKPRRALHQVYDPARYADLCARAGMETTNSGFPAYRFAPSPAAKQ
jgi:hypothetical protein